MRLLLVIVSTYLLQPSSALALERERVSFSQRAAGQGRLAVVRSWIEALRQRLNDLRRQSCERTYMRSYIQTCEAHRQVVQRLRTELGELHESEEVNDMLALLAEYERSMAPGVVTRNVCTEHVEALNSCFRGLRNDLEALRATQPIP